MWEDDLEVLGGGSKSHLPRVEVIDRMATPVISGVPRNSGKPARRVEAIPPTDAEAVAEAIEPESRVLVLTMIGTGARIGEAMALKVSDLDLDRQRLTISRTLSKDETSRVMISEGGKTENAANGAPQGGLWRGCGDERRETT
jgi:integrase